ncbi:MAG: ankyrin repeat domain-containing protein [Desulfomonilaceae bacterium]
MEKSRRAAHNVPLKPYGHLVVKQITRGILLFGKRFYRSGANMSYDSKLVYAAKVALVSIVLTSPVLCSRPLLAAEGQDLIGEPATGPKSAIDVNTAERKGIGMLCQLGLDAFPSFGTRGVHGLVAAAEGGLVERVLTILKSGVDVNARDYTGNTALYEASLAGHADVVDVLLQHKALPDATSTGGQTPLMAAAKNGNLDSAQLLITNGANVNLSDTKGSTALIQAAESGHLEISRLLLSKGANVNAADHNGDTALIQASKSGHLEIARLLLSKGANVNAANSNWRTPLLEAAYHSNLAIMRLLIENGANVNAADMDDGATPLIVVMRHRSAGYIEMAELLIDKGADIDAQARDGYTALHNAAAKGNNVEVKFLLNHGADPLIQGINGRTAYLVALSRGHMDTAKLLENLTSQKKR